MALSPNDAILISGASQGIGRAIAVMLASFTKRPLILLARNLNGLEETKKLCLKSGAKKVHCIPSDLTSKEDLDRLSSINVLKEVGMLINNAGYYVEESVIESELDVFQSQLEVNFLSAVSLTKIMLPFLAQKEQANIVFTGSVTAQHGQARCGAYSASKQALKGYVESLREGLKSTSVSVTHIILGQTWSPSWEGSGVDPSRLVLAEDIGKTIALLTTLSPQTCIEEIVIRPQQGDL